jgi:thiol-disulfide isomerase/thioredoxin
MNSKNSIMVLVAVVLLLGGFYFSRSGEIEETKMVVVDEQNTQTTGAKLMDEKSTNISTTGEVAKEMEEAGVVSTPGTYGAYDPAKLVKAAEGQVVLFFHANWCPECVRLNKDITENLAGIPSLLTILKVDYDNSSELKKKYGVTHQHTMVQVDANGNLLKKWSGSPTLSALVSKVQK